MFLLDTNVLSAMMTGTHDPHIAEWTRVHRVDDAYTSTVCRAEVFAGLAIMPLGRRRSMLEAAARAMFLDDFEGRVLPFHEAASDAYADIFAIRRRAGRPIAPLDLMIAATALAHGATVVTRNVTDFTGCGVLVVNPWDGVTTD